jgi:hypothetical protein
MQLPTLKSPPSKRDPRILVLYGAPKVGKTTKLAELEGCLIVDNERGTDYISALKVQVSTILQLREVAAELKKKPMTYRYVALDTVSTLEDWAEELATKNYQQSPVGKNFAGKSVLSLANGAGYFWLRQAFKELLQLFSGVTGTLILTAHLREKFLEKLGKEVTTKDIELTGKIRTIVCALADTVGYIYRSKSNDMMVSFEGNEDVLCGSRCDHLKGLSMPFDWSKIFTEPATNSPAPLVETNPPVA